MKRFVVISLAVFAGMAANASELVSETPYRAYGTPTTVSVSTSVWTKIPASQTLDGQNGLLVDVPAGNSANMVGHLGGCTSTAVAISVRPMEFIRGEGYVEVPVADTVCLWVLSLHTGAESIHVQEYKK